MVVPCEAGHCIRYLRLPSGQIALGTTGDNQTIVVNQDEWDAFKEAIISGSIAV
jgi:hypothetical protein